MSAQGIDPKRRALGRGLESLLPSKAAAAPVAIQAAAEAAPAGQALEIELPLIERNPFQTRQNFDLEKLAELAASIAASGVVQPITVRPLPDGRYQLITGERRLMASYKAEKKTIPAIVCTVSDQQAMEMTIVENLQRADLNPMEQARAFHRLSTEFNITQEQMAVRTGTGRQMIANFLRLLKLPEDVQFRVEQGQLSFGHARALLALPTRQDVANAAQKAIALNWSVRQLETFIQNFLHPDMAPVKDVTMPEMRDPNVREAETRLRTSLGLRVKIEDKRGKGKVIIEYANLEDFDALLGALNARPS